MKKRALWLGLMVLLLLLPAATAFADGPGWEYDDGRIFVGEDVVLEPGEAFNGDLGVFDGDLHMPEGSSVNGDVFVADGEAYVAGRVNGDVAVFGGKLELTGAGWVAGDVFSLGGEQEIAGHVRGDLSALGGDMVLRSSALVEGDLVVAPGNLEREAGAQVRGEDVHGITMPQFPLIPERPEITEVTPPVPRPIPPRHRTLGDRIGQFVGRMFSAGFMSVLVVALGLLVVFVWPRATERVADCITELPWQSFGLGLLTFLIAAGLEALAGVLMILIILVAAALIGTVILIPVGLLLILLSVLVLLPVPVALAGGMILGWVGLARWLGARVLKALKLRDVKPVGATLVGLLITVVLAAILWVAKPVCCGWPFVILLTSAGLGAVVHTRFGREDCRALQSTTAPSAPPAGDEPLPPEAMDEEAGEPDVPPGT